MPKISNALNKRHGYILDKSFEMQLNLTSSFTKL